VPDFALTSQLPIVQAPMAGGPSTPDLAAAVARAGGFGFVAGGYLTADALRDAVISTRNQADAPFGVNLFVPSAPSSPEPIERYARALQSEADRLGAELGRPAWHDDDFTEKIEVLLELRPAVVTFTFGCPDAPLHQRLHTAGIATGVTVTSLDEATIAARAGANVLVVQGTEAGGHQGSFDPEQPNRTALLDAVRDVARVGLPMIASGGIATGADAAAALHAGAAAVQIGTALLCTPEAATSPVYRTALLDKRYADTVITRAFSGRWARGLQNRFAREHADAPGGYPEIHYLTRPLRATATAAGDPDVPNLWAGTGWRSVQAEPAAEVVARIASELSAAR
jgi:nitronate monooxygenase